MLNPICMQLYVKTAKQTKVERKRRMRRVQRWLAIMLAAIMALGCITTVYAAPDDITVYLDVTYGQTEAREMLDMINDFRTGNDAWCWNEDDTERLKFDNLKELDYDYDLEQIAMQRAAELVVYYAHTRPDGSDSLSAIPGWGSSVWGYAENIAIGYTSAEEVFTAWQETNKSYTGQGHRRNMLGENYNRVGIGHAVYNGVECWVQEFTNSRTSLPAVTEPNDQTTTVQIDVSTNNIKSLTLKSIEGLTMQLDGSVDLPMVEGTMRLYGTWSSMPSATVEVMPDWTVADSSIAAIENGKLVAKSAGSTTISASVAGQTVTTSVTVTKIPLDTADVSLSQDIFSYVGKAIEPVPTVTLDGKTLAAGTDYIVSYENNKNVGKASVIITGTGSYSGSVKKNFIITECTHEWDEGTVTTPAGCESNGIMTYTCKLCGDTKTESIPAEGHKWDNGIVTIPAGCETSGVKTYTCTVCEDTYTEEIAATGHSFSEWTESKAPTCTEEGQEARTCGTCGKVETRSVNALGHDYDDGVITTEPTCTKEGVKTYICERCGDNYTESVGALGHDFGAWVTVTSPTCTDQGSEQRTCVRCRFTETRNTDATGHDWESDYTVDKQPTCTEDGSQSIHCSKCEAVKDTQVIPALGHNWNDGVETTAPGCETPGEKTYTCQRCGDTYTEPIPALEHEWNDGIITTEPTCTDAGVKTFTCGHCGDTKTEPVTALGHDYGEWTVTKPATCTEVGEKTRTCSRCGDVETETIAMIPHTWDSGVITTEPTCTAEGVKTFTCNVCGKTRTESVEKAPHTPVTDAAVEATCENTGLTEGSHCSVCGDVLTAQEIVPAKGHTWNEGVVTKDPTCTETGIMTYTCTSCGKTKTDSIDALGHDFGAWETVTSSTCTDQGSEKRVCSRCKYTETRNLDASGHIWESDYTIDKEPTCTTEGSESIHCSNCDAVKDAQAISALGHSWDEGVVTKAATCTATGEKTYTCSRCGDTYTETLPLAAHTLQWVTDKEATETEEGSRHEECTVCGWIGKTETIPALETEPTETPETDLNNSGSGNANNTNGNGNGNSGNNTSANTSNTNTTANANTSASTTRAGSAATARNTDQVNSPKTGDNSLIYVYVVIAVLAVGVMAILLVVKKRKA